MFAHYLYGTYFVAFNFNVYSSFLDNSNFVKSKFYFSTAGRNSFVEAESTYEEKPLDEKMALVQSMDKMEKTFKLAHVQLTSIQEQGASKWALKFHSSQGTVL